MAAEHSAAVHRHDPLHQTTYERFVLRVFWWQQQEFRPQRQDESLSQLKSCCHEDREDSASHLFCFQCCSSPVHWHIFQSLRTKKKDLLLSPKQQLTNFTSRVSGPIVYIVYVAHAAHGALSHDMTRIFAQRLPLDRAARLYFGFCDFFDGNGFLCELSTYDVYFGKRYSVQKVPKNPGKVGLSIFRAGGKKCLAGRGCTAQLTAWQGAPCHLEWSAGSERVNTIADNNIVCYACFDSLLPS